MLSLAQQVRDALDAELSIQDVTQTELERRTGKLQTYWSRRLTGHVDLRLADIEALAGALDVDVRLELVPREGHR